MDFRLRRQHKFWPAQWRLCRHLGFEACYDGDGDIGRKKGGEGIPLFTVKKMVVQYLRQEPIWRWHHLFLAFEEYWECIAYLSFLQKEARLVKTPWNQTLVNQILEQGCRDFIREMPDCWPELTGLITQKLRHLMYYDELKGSLLSFYGEK